MHCQCVSEPHSVAGCSPVAIASVRNSSALSDMVHSWTQGKSACIHDAAAHVSAKLASRPGAGQPCGQLLFLNRPFYSAANQLVVSSMGCGASKTVAQLQHPVEEQGPQSHGDAGCHGARAVQNKNKKVDFIVRVTFQLALNHFQAAECILVRV